MWLSHCDYFLFLSLYECRFNEKGNKEKEVDLIYVHSSYKKRKEKKLNMQGKGNMVLGYFIINIHMQLRRRGGLVIILSIPIAYTRFTKKLKREEADHTLLTQGKEEGGTRAVLQRRTHICIDINTQKEGSSSSILSNSYSFVNL